MNTKIEVTLSIKDLEKTIEIRNNDIDFSV